MRFIPAFCSVSLALVLTASEAQAANYPDATGEGAILGGAPHLDISSVDVSHNATTITFKINLVGDPVATDWGKYLIGIDSAPGGDAVGNGWGRPIGMSSGMDYFVGSWVDFGNGAEIRNWTGAWGLQSATYNPNPDGLTISKNATSVTVAFNYAGLGLGAGSSFFFDVYTSGGGGGDSAIDALANPAQTVANWGDYYNSEQHLNRYTIPEPVGVALLGVASLLLVRRRLAKRR